MCTSRHRAATLESIGPVVAGFDSPVCHKLPVCHKDDIRATQSAGAVVHLAHSRTPSVAVRIQVVLARKGLLCLWRCSRFEARHKHGSRQNGRTISCTASTLHVCRVRLAAAHRQLLCSHWHCLGRHLGLFACKPRSRQRPQLHVKHTDRQLTTAARCGAHGSSSSGSVAAKRSQ